MEVLPLGLDGVVSVRQSPLRDRTDGIRLQDLAEDIIMRQIIGNEVLDSTNIATPHLGFIECTCISWDQGWIPSLIS